MTVNVNVNKNIKTSGERHKPVGRPAGGTSEKQLEKTDHSGEGRVFQLILVTHRIVSST